MGPALGRDLSVGAAAGGQGVGARTPAGDERSSRATRAAARAARGARVSGDRLRKGDEVLGHGHPHYPSALRRLHRPPDPLYLRGSHRAWDQPAVAVVGARAATSAGRRWAGELAGDLARRGIVVVSGLARGIDRAAHEGALAAGGVTVAVIGTGLDVAYPREHRELRRRIEDSGAVMTEFPSGTLPRTYHFPRRNRILAALSLGVVVVEAGTRSGALNTAHWALEQGIEVMAVPRNPWEPGTAGGNRLIRQGATPVTGIGDVLETLFGAGHALGEPGARARTAAREQLESDPLWQALGRGAASLEELLQAIPAASPAELLTRLGRLEIEGLVRRGAQGYEWTGAGDHAGVSR
ncbi:MAG: DNA-protecting protein DprA [Candidatus Eisenbacteria bacterium]|nr:DNA-protecting protein DprA [Candidatus Eisenbacteria bacterium]